MPIIQLIVILVVVGVALYLIELIPMDAIIKTVIKVLVILFVVLWVLETLGLLTAGPVLRLH